MRTIEFDPAWAFSGRPLRRYYEADDAELEAGYWVQHNCFIKNYVATTHRLNDYSRFERDIAAFLWASVLSYAFSFEI